MDADLARELREFRSPTDGETRMFYEIVIAPGYTPEGLEVLKGKSKTVRGRWAPRQGGVCMSDPRGPAWCNGPCLCGPAPEQFHAPAWLPCARARHPQHAPPPPSPPSQLRILEAQPRAPSGRSLRQVSAGWLQQGADSLQPSGIEFTCVSEVQPTPQQLEDLKFAW